MQDPVSKSLLSKHSLLLTVAWCKKLLTQMSHALLLVCPAVRIVSLELLSMAEQELRRHQKGAGRRYCVFATSSSSPTPMSR